MVIKYEDTKIYKIYSHVGNMIYIGSTTKQLLSQRMAKHRSDYKYWKSGRGSFINSFKMFDEYGPENCFIELIEANPCINRDDKNKLEGKYIRELECVNKNIAGRTMKEYNEDNKEKKKEYNKQYFPKYYEQNKDKIKENAKQYIEDNKDKIKERVKQYYEDNKETIKEKKKQYGQDNKEIISERNKIYRNINATKIKERRGESKICECGLSYTHDHRARHLRTLKHKKYLESQNE
jgi:gas vesicle protein